MDLILINKHIGIITVVITAIAFYLIGNKYGKSIKKHFPRILSHYSIYFALVILLTSLLVADDSLQQGMFTFSSVYLAFWLGNLQNILNERRVERFYLGLLWNELRVNEHVLHNLMLNYNFFLEDFGAMPYFFIRFSSVSKHLNHLKNSAYLSCLNSASITSVSSDDVFNNVEIAYNDVVYLKSLIGILDTEFMNKAALLEKGLVTDANLQKVLLEDAKNKILSGAEEISIVFSTTKRAKSQLSDLLSKLDVKVSEEELRTDLIGAEERKFISKVLRQKPAEPTVHNTTTI